MADGSLTICERRAPWLVAVAALALAAWALWRAFGPQGYGDPLATSLVAFEKQIG